MKKIFQVPVTAGFLLLASLTSFSTTMEGPEKESSPKFVVLVYNYADVSGKVLIKAKREVDSVFRKAGVEVYWRDCWPIPAEPEPQYADQPDSIPIRLRIIRRTKAQRNLMRSKSTGFVVHPGEKGVGTLAIVFYDRVEHVAEDGAYPFSLILGMVAAHEIGHLLLPTAVHHPHGIMRAPLRAEDWRWASQRKLSFTKEQSASIRRGLRARAIG